MRKKKSLIMALIILGIFTSVITITSVQSDILPIYDEVNDVTKKVAGVEEGTGDFADEIDIVMVRFDSPATIVLECDGTPVLTAPDYLYYIKIIWSVDEHNCYANVTEISADTIGGSSTIFAYSEFYNTSGYQIVDELETEIVTIEGNYLKATVNATSLITDPTNPLEVHVETQHAENSGTTEQIDYSDQLDYLPEEDTPPTSSNNNSTETNITPGFVTISTIAGLATMLTIHCSKRKKR